jgi:hypothetical protein
MPASKHKHDKFVLCMLLFLITASSYAKENKILLHPAPIVNYSMSHFCLGDTTYFTNTSILGTTYEWDIYKLVNGSHGTVSDSLIFTSNDFNINYLFSSGLYSIVLTGYNGHTTTITRNLTIDSISHANFDYTTCGSKFINTSVCYDSCLWDFGDGQTSVEDSPVHFFDSLNIWYPVKLTTYNSNSTDIYIDSIFANSPNNLNGNFTYKINKDSVLFIANDSISGPFTQYHWSFGDGTVADLTTLSNGRRLYHIYPKKDTTYAVFLLVKTSCLNAFSKTTIFVPDSTPVNDTYIYPNPISENLILHIATNRKNELTDMNIVNCLGEAIYNHIFIETFKGFDSDISALAKGLYFIKLNFIDCTIIKKIVKE